MQVELISTINAARAGRRAIAVITVLESGEQRSVSPEDAADDPLASELEGRFRSGKSGVISADCGDVFIQIHAPSPRLVIIGAVHIAQALFPMAQSCGFEVSIIDPRTAFATKDRFADVTLHADWPQDVLEGVVLDRYTALAAITHDPKIDDLPLQRALEEGCFYVGALGSRKTHAKRLDRLKAAGVSDERISSILAPIGLDIGAASPAEIAVAIMAQVISAMRQGVAA